MREGADKADKADKAKHGGLLVDAFKEKFNDNDTQKDVNSTSHFAFTFFRHHSPYAISLRSTALSDSTMTRLKG
ncbi:hypothetical protein A1OU_18090 [Enterovibrio norvegicus]|nr:hypothetical protein A1OU_18090 [Enterovibrio norvegicus]